MLIATIIVAQSNRRYELELMPQVNLLQFWTSITNASSFDTIPTRGLMIAEILEREFPGSSGFSDDETVLE